MQNERGFSIVELIVAMTVTLIVSSAIYGLLAAGGNAFRREPEVADRQQNIRAAMDIVTRDIYGAGAALSTFSQVFTRNDPAGACVGSLNSCGPVGSMGPAAALARGGDDEDTDVLEIVSTDEQCPQLGVCSTGGGSPIPGTAGLFVTQESLPRCLGVPGLVALVADSTFTIVAATASGGTTSCTVAGASPPNGNLTLSPTLAPWVGVGFSNPNPNPGTANSVYLYRARLVRYRVAPNPDPLDPVPSLWRTETGLFNPNGSAAIEPGTPGFNPVGSPWQLVARGIEDLQFEYLDGNGAWLNQPPVSVVNDWTTLVRQVRVTMSARASQANLGGESSAGGGAPDAVRGQLSSVVTPRATFNELQMCLSAVPACSAASHIQ